MRMTVPMLVRLQAEFLWNHQVFSPADSEVDFLPKSDMGIGFDVKTDATNNLLRALSQGGKLDGDLSYQEVQSVQTICDFIWENPAYGGYKIT